MRPRRSVSHRESVKLSRSTTRQTKPTVAKLYDGVPQLWASIHLAGGFAMGTVAETDKAALIQQVDMNFVACFLCCRAAVNAMARTAADASSTSRRGRAGMASGAGMAAYTASKAGVAALTVALAEEVAKDGILVNAVAPSIMDTPANRRRCRRRTSPPGRRSRRSRRRSCSWPRPRTLSRAAAIVPVYGKADLTLEDFAHLVEVKSIILRTAGSTGRHGRGSTGNST